MSCLPTAALTAFREVLGRPRCAGSPSRASGSARRRRTDGRAVSTRRSDTPDLTELARAVRWPPVDPQDAARIGARRGRPRRPLRPAGGARGLVGERAERRRRAPAGRAVGLRRHEPPAGPGSPARPPAALGPPAGAATRRSPGASPPRTPSSTRAPTSCSSRSSEPRARRVLAAELLGTDAVDALGWPVPVDDIIDDAQWMADVVALRDGLRAVKGLAGDPAALLDALGNARLAAATGLLLGAAARRTPAVLDGPGAAATRAARALPGVGGAGLVAGRAARRPSRCRTAFSACSG